MLAISGRGAISIFIEDAAEVFNLDYECLGSTTWKSPISKVGVEPDNCFYFQNEPLITHPVKLRV